MCHYDDMSLGRKVTCCHGDISPGRKVPCRYDNMGLGGNSI